MAGPCICWPSGGFGDVNASGQAERADAWLGSVRELCSYRSFVVFPAGAPLIIRSQTPATRNGPTLDDLGTAAGG
jgi:hypothetical protein